MRAYFYHGPYVANWKNKNFILNTIKAQGTRNFAQLGPGAYQFRNGEALYFYGGRTALLQSLATSQTEDWTMDDHRDCVMVVYRGAVAAKLKTKQIIVISCVLATNEAQQINDATNPRGNDGLYVERSTYRYRKRDLVRLIEAIPD
jgi:hypothetical protein